MMRFKNKKGQAAIEFLMTYGWMLLVVLIVGALIFSFVDFGSLLPNKVEFSSVNIQPIVADSFATVGAGGSGRILIAFKYNGVSPIEFDYDNTGKYNVSYNYGDSSCVDVLRIYNNDIGQESTSASPNPIRFRNGHSGYVEFQNCADFDQVDVVEGSVRMEYTSTQTGASTPFSGSLRLTKSG